MTSHEGFGAVLEKENGGFIVADAIQDTDLKPEISFISPGFEVQNLPDSDESVHEQSDCSLGIDDFPGSHIIKPVQVVEGLYPEGKGYHPDYRFLQLFIPEETEKDWGHGYFVNHPRRQEGIFQLASEGRSEDVEFFTDGNHRAEVSRGTYPITGSIVNHQGGGSDRPLTKVSRALDGSTQVNAINAILDGQIEREEQNIAGYYTQGGNKWEIEGEVRSWQIEDTTVFFNGYVEELEDGGKDVITGLIQEGRLGLIKTPEPGIHGYEVVYVAEESAEGFFEGNWMLLQNPHSSLSYKSGEVQIGIDREARYHQLSEFA